MTFSNSGLNQIDVTIACLDIANLCELLSTHPKTLTEELAVPCTGFPSTHRSAVGSVDSFFAGHHRSLQSRPTKEAVVQLEEMKSPGKDLVGADVGLGVLEWNDFWSVWSSVGHFGWFGMR